MMNMICRLLVLLLLPSLGFAQQTWELQNSNFPYGVVVASLSAVNNQVCWAAGLMTPVNSRPYPGYIRTIDGGNTWVCDSIPGAETGYLSQILALDADTAYAAVYQWPASPTKPKGVFKTTDGGATWTKQIAYLSNIYGPGYIHFFDAHNGVVIGDPNLETYTTTNGGRNWNAVSMPLALTDEYTIIGGTAIEGKGNRVWFGTTKRIFRSTDRGYTWSTSGTTYRTAQPSIAFQDSNTGIYTLLDGSPLHVYRKTTDGGVTWSDLTNPVIDGIYPTCIRHVPGTASTYLVAGGWSEGRGFACTHNAGGDWRLIDNSGNGIIIFPSDSIGWGAPANAPSVYKYIGPRLITSVEGGTTAPASYLLEQNFPNPFNPSTTIKYELPKSSTVKLIVYDLLGREVSLLVNERRDAGVYEVKFDGLTLASGVYVYRLQAGDFVQSRKLTILK